MARVLVTGSEGFIGGALVNGLIHANNTVVGLDLRNPSHSRPRPRYEVILGDIEKLSDVERAANGVEIVYHLAGVSNLNLARERPRETVESNVRGTANLLDVCRRKGIKMIFASSDHVYGAQQSRVLTESEPVFPAEIYAASKAAAEQIIRAYGVNGTILRFGTVYGPRMRKELAVHVFLAKALQGEALGIHSPGTQKRQYIYVDDIVEACILAMKPEADGLTFNLPGSEPVSVVDLANTCIRVARSKSTLTFLPSRPSDIDSGLISFERARRTLGWVPKISLEEGLTRTLEWIIASEEGMILPSNSWQELPQHQTQNSLSQE